MPKVPFVLTVFAAISGGAMAQTVSMKAEDVIAARRGSMAVSDGLMDAMKAAVASSADPKVYASGAAGLGKYLKSHAGMFPDGTQTGTTRAKAEIWSDRAGFDKAVAVSVAAAATLEEAAKGGDKAAFAAAFQTMGQSCVACHRAYRSR